MDRLQKKCFLASAGFHLLLALILLVGPAFLVSKSKPDDMEVLDFIPIKTVDALVSGGGNPNAKPPPAITPPAPEPRTAPPAPAPEPPTARPPEPPKEVIKDPPPTKPETDSLEPSPERNRKPVIDTTKSVVRRRDTKADAKAQAEALAEEQAREEARAIADRRRKMAKLLGSTANGLASSLSSSTTIELKGPGGGGVPYANFLAGVKTIYTDAWIVPDGVTDDNATVMASVTIARDGSVVSSRITRSSGNPAVDRSVQVTLDRVKRAVPLPDDAREDQRTVSINFNVKAKRALG